MRFPDRDASPCPLLSTHSFALFVPAANRKELVTDFLRKAKQLEYLIDSLPSPPSQDELETEYDLAQLETEAQETNREYLLALEEAGESSPLSPRYRDRVTTDF